MGSRVSGTMKQSVGRAAKSLSSAKTAKSKTKPDVLGLGAEIAKQLGEAAEQDIMASWMAEYLGEKISEVERAQGKERESLEKDCAELVLKLWDHRHQLPNGARPLESFEPLFVALSELSRDKPRNHLLRDLPQTDKQSEVGKIIQGILAIDQSTSTLIRYLLAEAVGKVPKGDKRWASVLKSTTVTDWDINIIRILMDDAEAISDQQEKLKKQQREKLEAMLASLEDLEGLVAPLRMLLEEQIMLCN